MSGCRLLFVLQIFRPIQIKNKGWGNVGPPSVYLYMYVTWPFALLCYRATGAIAPHCGFSGSRRMETAPTSIEVHLRPALVQSDEPSDLRGSLSPTTRHRCMHALAYTAPGVCQVVTHPIMEWGQRCLTSVIKPTPMS